MSRPMCLLFRFKFSRVHLHFRKISSRGFSLINKSYFPNYNLKIAKMNLHSSAPCKKKIFINNENIYAYDIITKDYEQHPPVNIDHEVTTLDEFNTILNQNWKESSSSNIVKAFMSTQKFCFSNNITLSDSRFDNLVDGLMDNCEKLSDDELINLLYSISDFPSCETYHSHNFHDIWSCLDDICCWKMTDWSVDTCFIVANAWYKLNLGRICDFIFVLIDRFVKKADRLSKGQLVNMFFYFNLCRKRAVDFEYEFALEKFVKYMSADEMAIVAMGYFKTKTKIKLLPIMEAMIQEVIINSKSIHEISLTAILKVLRLSKPIKLSNEVSHMLDVLQHEIHRLSELCCLHIALMGTGVQTYHETSLQKASQKIASNITDKEKIRLKDIERILNALTMFNCDPKTNPDIYESAFIELHKQNRIEERIKYPRCLPCALNYFSLRNIYSYELMDRILDSEFIEESYGKGAKMLGRELFSLDCSIEIECPGYKGNRLPLNLKYKGAKWLTDFAPAHDQWKKKTAADKLFLDTADTVKQVVGDDSFMFIQHILPHFAKADIILCRDRTGQFVKPIGFENYVFGDVMFPFNNGHLKWFAIVVLTWNNTMKCGNAYMPLGNMLMKKRQLEKMGYNPVFVFWNEFLDLSSEMRYKYVKSRIGK
nr:FAST kinase domain-containing protein 5, mitochondrial isoform X2 [Leptinotarsa decemlineata]